MSAVEPLAVATYAPPTRMQMRRDLVTTPANSLPPGVPAIDYTTKRLNVGVDVTVDANRFLSFITAAEVTATYITAAQANATFLKLAGGTLTGPLVLAGDGGTNLQAVTVQQMNAGLNAVSGSLANYLPLSGGTLTGALTLKADAAANLQPVSLQQMNAALAAVPSPLAVFDEGVSVIASTIRLNFLGSGVTVASGGAGIAAVTIPGADSASLVRIMNDWPVQGLS